MDLNDRACRASLRGLGEFRRFWEGLTPRERVRIGARERDALKADAMAVDFFVHAAQSAFPGADVVAVRAMAEELA